MLPIFIIIALVCLSEQKPSEPSGDPCKTPLNRGTSECKGAKKGIKWFYDSELDDCFEYFFEGCKAGVNSFDDKNSCIGRCILLDQLKCGGNAKYTDTCSQTNEKCPKGSKCSLGAVGGGICCSIKNEEEWKKEREPKCKQGTLSKVKEWYGEEPRFGKSCSHKFCPKGHKCVQGKRLAHCCSEH